MNQHTTNTFIIGHTQPRPEEPRAENFPSHALKIDIPTLLDTRMIVCANSGGGKSWLFRLIAERAGKSVSTWVIDPEGEYATLREWLDIAVVGGKGEIPLTVNSAAMTARRLYEASVGAVFDLSDLDIDEKRACVERIVIELLRVSKRPTHSLFFFVDEAHQLCPQVGTVESSAAIKRIMDSGRKREICGMLATQRVTKLHNDAIGEARNVAIGLTNLGADQERAGDLLGMNKQQRGLLSRVGKGEFYLYGPSVLAEGVQFFKSDQVRTTHPQVGQRSLMQVPPASEAMQKLLGKLGDLPAQAQEEVREIETLRRENARLQYEIKARPTQIQVPEPRVEIQVIEKPVLNGEVKEFVASARDVIQVLTAFPERMAEILNPTFKPLNESLGKVLTKVEQVQNWQAPAPAPPREFVRVPNPTPLYQTPRSSPPTRPAQSGAGALNGTEGLTNPQQRILDALAEFEALGITMPHKSNVAVFSDQSPRSSGFQNNLGRLRTLHYIAYQGSGRVMLTDAGRAFANPAGAIRTLQDLHHAWYARLTRPQSKILEQIIAAYPHPVGKNELAERAGQSATSSGYQNNLGALRSLGLLDYPRAGFVVATTLLFPDGLR